MHGFTPKPRKVHFAWPQQHRGRKHKVADTLCALNSDVPAAFITHDHDKVTCQICRRHRDFRVLRSAKARSDAVLRQPANLQEAHEQQLPPAPRPSKAGRLARKEWREAKRMPLCTLSQLIAVAGSVMATYRGDVEMSLQWLTILFVLNIQRLIIKDKP